MRKDVTVLLIDPVNLGGHVSEGGENRPTTPNLGLLYIAALLKRECGARVVFIDNGLELHGRDALSRISRETAPDIVGISSKTFNILGAYDTAKAVKAALPDVPVLLGGAHGTALPEYTLGECPELDCIVRREGELTISEIVSRLQHGARGAELFSGVKGVTYRAPGGGYVSEEDRELIGDLDSLPMPDFSLVDYRRYSRIYNPKKHSFQHVFPIFASRGCPFNCTFCMPLHSRKHRVRSIDNVLDEVEYMHEKLDARRIYFEDSLFCSNREWFAGFCEMFKARGLHRKINWGFETRIDTAFKEMFEMAVDAGCIYSFFGVESGSEEILRKAKKKYTRAKILDVVDAASRAGMADVKMSIILGLPYETRKTALETLSLIEEANCTGASVNILDAYPGTEVFDMVERGEGGLRWCEGARMNWDSYVRVEPQMEVNDLSASDLLELRARALEIIRAKRRRRMLDYNVMRLAHFKELLFTDRARLKRSILDTIAGRK